MVLALSRREAIVTNDVIQCCGDLIRIRRLRTKKSACGLGIAGYRGQRLIELMRQTCGRFTEQAKPFALGIEVDDALEMAEQTEC